MKHIADNQTVELPGIPAIPVKRGRKAITGVPMTAAQRKRRSRFRQMQAALKTDGIANKIPVQLGCTVDESTRRWLKAQARQMGCSVGDMVDVLVRAARDKTASNA
ncbi:hypothetical protein IGB42_03974 [Andreprevotia sp. IGB-42]|uniref:hypothetical protein n=1 Tax=Andreprevotia sp. IGB-42 TaxID=2497473 RepID=UPI00135BF754|nr:hypothetical protein [Andreprevotia sp. IGB-42]KAF0811588.1 hypothetical protein IGB42_03974 [Andreprevotia sp. IGB-42]